MAKKRIKSRPGLFGVTYYYDGNGKQVGKSRPGLLGGTQVFFDQDGNYAGRSRPGFFAKEVFTSADNERITTSHSFLGEVHFKNGRPVGKSRPGFFNRTYTSLDLDEETED